MRLAEAFAASPWIGWAVALMLGYPLLAVVLSEVLERVEDHRRSLHGPVRHLRNVTLPLLALLIFLQKLVGLPPEDTAVKLAYTAMLVSVFFALLSLANAMLFSEASEDSWRARVPKLFLDLSRVFFVFLGLAMVLALVWDQDLRGLFAALGIGSLVIGLALQDTLGNLFSGVALLFEKPFSVGEFIRVGEREGRVTGMTWRTTRLHVNATHSTLVIPNLALAKEQIVNLSRPGFPVVRVPIRFSTEDAPNAVKCVLIETASFVPGVVSDPAPSAATIAYGEGWIDYEACFTVASFPARSIARDEYVSRLWYAARRRGLTLSPATGSVQRQGIEPVREEASGPDRVRAQLAGIPVLQGLPEDAMQDLAANAAVLRFARGEIVFREGDGSATMYILLEGDVLLTTSHPPRRRRPADDIGRERRGARRDASFAG
jgi:small-conductance mechanosensitive channel